MRSGHDIHDIRVLASGDKFALISTVTSALPYSLLVQVMGMNYASRPSFSLYVVYREAGMTFDAIARFAVDAGGPRLDDLLAQFIGDDDFERSVLRPIEARVRDHFRR